MRLSGRVVFMEEVVGCVVIRVLLFRSWWFYSLLFVWFWDRFRGNVLRCLVVGFDLGYVGGLVLLVLFDYFLRNIFIRFSIFLFIFLCYFYFV